MNWETIKQQVLEDDHEKWDLNVPTASLALNTSGLLEVSSNGNSGKFGLTEHAITQLCQRLSIPARYFKRLPKEMQAQLANYDLGRLDDSTFLMRGKGQAIRAVLSDKYVAYNNRQVIEAVSAAIAGDGLAVKSFVLEERFMFIKLVSVTLADEVLELKTGVMITNSEVGCAQVAVEPFLYRKPCTNDLIVAEEAAFRHRHVDYSADKFNSRVAESIATGLKLAEGALARAWTAAQTNVADPKAEIERLGKHLKLSEKFVNEVQLAFQQEPVGTRWGVVNGFTRAAQKLGPVQRIEVERLAGRMLAA